MLHPLIRQIDEDVADRMLAMITYLSNGGLSASAATTLTAAAFAGHAMPFFIDREGKLTPQDPDAPTG